MFLTVLVAVVVLGVLIFVHELGHFMAAKAVGVGVPRFSIGFGPPTPLTFRHGETEYVVSWFPLGGYVKMASQEEQEAMSAMEGGATGDAFPPEKMFENKPLAARMLVIVAGVAMNALFAWVAYSGVAAVSGRSEDPTTTIARFDADALPAAALALGDIPFGTQIVRVNGDSVRSWQAIIASIMDPKGDRLRFDFAGGHDPVIVPISGTDARARMRIASALKMAHEPRIGLVAVGEPADQAGIRSGDLVVAVSGDTVRSFDDIVQTVEPSAGDTLAFTVLRDGVLLTLPIVPIERRVQDPFSREVYSAGRIGVGPLSTPLRVRFGIGGALVEGVRLVWRDADLVFFTLKGMVVGTISPRDLGGPILIGQISGQVARLGPVALVLFMAFLSVNLAILNLLPIPVLDGGQLLFLVVEGVRGKPLSLDMRLRLTQLGVVVLLGIFALVFVNDIVRLFGG